MLDHKSLVKTHPSLYEAYRAMKRRCSSVVCRDYKDYGARGIKVCERWKYFVNFFEDMGERPVGMTLERIDNDGPYSPDNCRWATRTEQAKNRKSTKFLTLNGKTLCITDWAKTIGIKPNTLVHRLLNGWPVEKALIP